MTANQFKRYMQMGLGRCYLQLRGAEDIERYREVVQWGCLHNLAWDTQSEGTRAQYVYDLVRCFPDPASFLPAVLQQFERIGSAHGGGYTLAHYIALLQCYARDGYAEAKQAIWQRYRKQLDVVSRRRKHVYYFDYEIEILDRTAMALLSLEGEAVCRTLAQDYDRLLGIGLYNDLDFEWILQDIVYNHIDLYTALLQQEEDCTHRFCRALLRANKNKERLERLLAGENVDFDDDPIEDPHETTHIEAEDEGQTVEQPVDQAKQALLNDLEQAPDKFDFDDLVHWAAQGDEDVAQAALYALFRYKSPIAAPYVLQILRQGPNDWYGLALILQNYRDMYRDDLLAALYRQPVSYQNGDWHMALGAILDAEENRPLPPEFLLVVYERSLCSGCRAEAVRYLDKHGLLTPDLAAECAYDSNKEIRRYIANRN